jgi:hypothetical protein
VKPQREYKNGQIAIWRDPEPRRVQDKRGDEETKEDFKFQIADCKLKTPGEKDTSNSDCGMRLPSPKRFGE